MTAPTASSLQRTGEERSAMPVSSLSRGELLSYIYEGHYLTELLLQVEEASSKHGEELGARGRRSDGARHQEHLQAEEEGESGAL